MDVRLNSNITTAFTQQGIQPDALRSRILRQNAEHPSPRQADAELNIEAGFGRNSVSPLGAAVIAVSNNLQGARQIAETSEQIRAEFRQRRAELEAERGLRPEAFESVEQPAEQTVRLEAEPQARFFEPAQSVIEPAAQDLGNAQAQEQQVPTEPVEPPPPQEPTPRLDLSI